MSLKPDNSISVPLQGTKVAVAIPSYGNQVSVATLNGVALAFGEFARHGVQALLMTCNDSILHKNRNILANMFLESDADYLIFIDSDMGFAPESILRLIAGAKNSGVDILGAAGLMKMEKKRFCVELFYPLEIENSSQLIKAKGIGTAFLLISKKVIQTLSDSSTKFKPTVESEKFIANIFDTQIDDDGHFWSEDYVFCKKATEAGFSTWLDPNINLVHVGQKEWSGSPAEDIKEKFLEHNNCSFGIAAKEA